MKTLLITGGAGFIGSAVVRFLIGNTETRVINLDKLTYAGNLQSLDGIDSADRYRFIHGDINDRALVAGILRDFKPDAVMHLAAESHVDRSIDGPMEFVETNVVGTANLLEVCRHYWREQNRSFVFHHVSTDEVYGSLGETGLFHEGSPYRPNSPYSASKASSDHLVRSWHRTYGLPVKITNCSNNYGPFQHPEKLIPLMILNAAEGKPLPVYGKGFNVRDWLYVDDHVQALWTVLQHGLIGETYNIGGDTEVRNIDVVRSICLLLDEKLGSLQDGMAREQLIEFVEDRPGHDQRYAMDNSKINNQLNWYPTETFESGISKTIDWYLANSAWCEQMFERGYHRERLGLDKLES